MFFFLVEKIDQRQGKVQAVHLFKQVDTPVNGNLEVPRLVVKSDWLHVPLK